MKTIFTFITVVLIGCSNYPKYEIAVTTKVPDSLNQRREQFIIEVVRAASLHMTGGDYEDPEDVIEEADNIFIGMYATPVKGLRVWNCHGCYPEFITPKEMDVEQKLIFEKLSK